MAPRNPKFHAAGSQHMQAVIALLPEEKRAEAIAVFQGEAVDPALELIGERAMLRDDYSRRQNEITDHWNTLNAWYAANEVKVREHDAAVARVALLEGGTPHPQPQPAMGPVPPATPPPLTREQLIRTLGVDPSTLATQAQVADANASLERGVLSFYQEVNPLSLEHYKTFGEVLDIREVLAQPDVRTQGFQNTYLQVHKDKFDKLADARQQAHDATIREQAVADFQKSHTGTNGFPIPGRSFPSLHTSPLEALEASMRTPAQSPAQTGGTPGISQTAPGPGHTNLADDGALVDRAVQQFLERAQALGRPISPL